MQTTILIVTLLLMAVVAVACLRAIWATETAEIPATANSMRTKLIWGLVVLGIVVTVASLREWPHRTAGTDALVVNVTSGQWWWETDTTEIPVGKEVEFHVTTEDVNHGLGIYNDTNRLLFQVQAMPGYTNKVVYTFEEPGTYEILCMEFCGVGHHDMINEFEVVEANQ